MKTKSFLTLLISISCFLILVSCTSNNDSNNENNICDQIALLNVQNFTPVILGDNIHLTADYLEGVQYHWFGPNGFEDYGADIYVTTDAKYSDNGTYTVVMSYEGCTDRTLNVDVVVNFPQGSPSCTLINNSAQFSGSVILGNQTYGFMTWGSAAVGDNYEIVANGTNGDMYMYLSPYWKTHELVDGIYYTTTNNSPELADYNKIYISNVNGGIFWQCQANQPVYISHVGGKARISFCDVTFSGSLGGPSYQTTIKAQITKP